MTLPTTGSVSISASRRDAPPSRHSNPFATCWTRPAALPFLADADDDPQAVWRRVAAAGGRGQVVGPHGAGKSTLLAALAVASSDARVAALRVDRGDALRHARGVPRGGVALVEGFERLAWPRRLAVLATLASRRSGWVVTTHRAFWSPWGTPVVARLAPSEALARRLHALLTETRPSPVSADELVKALARSGGDLRAALAEAYASHERLTRGEPR